MKLQYVLVIEDAGGNFSGFVPDLPVCFTVGDTIEEVRRNAVEAVEVHLMDGEEPPAPRSLAEILAALKEDLSGEEIFATVTYEQRGELAHA